MVKDAYSDSDTNFKFSLLFINVAHKYKDTIQLEAKGGKSTDLSIALSLLAR